MSTRQEKITTVKQNNLNNLDIFSLNEKVNIVEEEHLGIFNGMLTINTTFRNVLSYRSLYAPPYASSDFLLEIRLFGEKVVTDKYKWYPFGIQRKGEIKNIIVNSSFILPDNVRAGIMAITLENQESIKKYIPLQFNIKGGLDYINFWGFGRPRGIKRCITTCKEKRLIKKNDSGAIVIGTNIENLSWENFSSHWEANMTLSPNEKKTVYVAIGIGNIQEANYNCDQILKNPEETIKKTYNIWSKKIDDLFTKLPKLESKNESLVKFYNRSLLPSLLNRWEEPEFILHPYYSTGGLIGGCVGNYLWNYGEPYKVLPLYDPQATREHIKQFLNIDLTAHFAFNPVDGKGFGPWYPINQEKIILLIYYYVLHTGDIQFLNEEVNGKSILDWAIYQATYKDDFNKPAVLVDYGKGNNHLELRREYRYDNYLPDLNGKRYLSYKLVEILCNLVHKKSINFSKRAEDLKLLIKDSLWDKKNKWFFFLDEKMNKHIRYTIQLFKLFGTGVLDKEEEEGLLSHLNEQEFLSAYGIHSMSKKDPAYDQIDIDNGGGGICTGFPPTIIERLYKSGYPEEAEDILKRILWWGERLPYYFDSQVANNIDYRHDSPLINAIDALAGAQCIIFGMFGIEVEFNGNIIINPHPPTFSPEITLTGLKIRGVNIDILVKNREYEVRIDNKVISSKVGIPILFQAENKKLKLLS